MRVRYWVFIAAAMLALGLTGCSTARVSRGTANTPVPTKTLRPTFTATVPKPTLTPNPADAAAGQPASVEQAPATNATPAPEAPTATTEPPTIEPSPTAEPAAFTVNSASLNVRSGPSTAFGIIGRLSNGQSFPITGKNNDESWWQFDYNGRTGWVAGSNVSVRGSDTVEVAQNIPAAPTAAPRPTARPAAAVPAPPQPQPQPQPSVKYSLTKSELRPNTNPIVSVWCFVLNQGGNGVLGGTMRVLQGGTTVKEQPFNAVMARGDPGYSSEYLYSDGCKVELPAADGAYSAYLIEGGAQVSDVYNFTVSGETNRITIVEWKQR